MDCRRRLQSGHFDFSFADPNARTAEADGDLSDPAPRVVEVSKEVVRNEAGGRFLEPARVAHHHKRSLDRGTGIMAQEAAGCFDERYGLTLLVGLLDKQPDRRSVGPGTQGAPRHLPRRPGGRCGGRHATAGTTPRTGPRTDR